MQRQKLLALLAFGLVACSGHTGQVNVTPQEAQIACRVGCSAAAAVLPRPNPTALAICMDACDKLAPTPTAVPATTTATPLVPVATSTAVPTATATDSASTASPTATTQMTDSATPTATTAPLVIWEPKLNGVGGSSPIIEKGGHAELTEHFVPKPAADVIDEIPASILNTPLHGAANCDSDHWFDPDGTSKTIMWWVCGGSVRKGTSPRAFDDMRGFKLDASPGVTLTYYPTAPKFKWGCFRNDRFNFCAEGTGTVTVCALADVRTCRDPSDVSPDCPSGIISIPVAKSCTTRLVKN